MSAQPPQTLNVLFKSGSPFNTRTASLTWNGSIWEQYYPNPDMYWVGVYPETPYRMHITAYYGYQQNAICYTVLR